MLLYFKRTTYEITISIELGLPTRFLTKTRKSQTNSLELELELHLDEQTAWNKN